MSLAWPGHCLVYRACRVSRRALRVLQRLRVPSAETELAASAYACGGDVGRIGSRGPLAAPAHTCGGDEPRRGQPRGSVCSQPSWAVFGPRSRNAGRGEGAGRLGSFGCGLGGWHSGINPAARMRWRKAGGWQRSAGSCGVELALARAPWVDYYTASARPAKHTVRRGLRATSAGLFPS